MSENWGYWKYNGKNGLVGKESHYVELPGNRFLLVRDPDLPAVLEDSFIAYALQHSRIARSDFCRLFPGLDSESQARLTKLIAQNRRATSLLRDSQDFHDAVQAAQVTAGVRPHAVDETRPWNEGVADRVKGG